MTEERNVPRRSWRGQPWGLAGGGQEEPASPRAPWSSLWVPAKWMQQPAGGRLTQEGQTCRGWGWCTLNRPQAIRAEHSAHLHKTSTTAMLAACHNRTGKGYLPLSGSLFSYSNFTLLLLLPRCGSLLLRDSSPNILAWHSTPSKISSTPFKAYLPQLRKILHLSQVVSPLSCIWQLSTSLPSSYQPAFRHCPGKS